jgi:hypothetical protein
MGISGTRVKVGEVPVDSGQVFVVDPCYVLDGEVEFEGNDDGQYVVSSDNPYSRACAASCSEEQAGPFRASAVTHTPLGKPIDVNAMPDAVCTSTGWGDGLYPVYVEYDRDGRVARLIVEFMEDELNQLHKEKMKNEEKAKQDFENRIKETRKKAIQENIELAKKSGNVLTQTLDEEGNLVGVKDRINFDEREAAEKDTTSVHAEQLKAAIENAKNLEYSA